MDISSIELAKEIERGEKAPPSFDFSNLLKSRSSGGVRGPPISSREKRKAY
jgi:hypothetical protein